MKRIAPFLLALCLLLTAACSPVPADRPEKEAETEPAERETEKAGGEEMEATEEAREPGTWVMISQEEAMERMQRDDGHIVLDVRREDEYAAAHIPGAVLLPNESIGDEPPELLPDRDQIILIYCRSGNRSKQAAQKLADMGYVNVYEFGGINTWPGEIVSEETGSGGT